MMLQLSIDTDLRIPKYKQIVKSIESGILEGSLKRGDTLPSINEVRDQFGISRDTVLMAFNELKTRGIAESIAGKGYFVKSEDIEVAEKIFMLFDELNTFKEQIYNSFRAAIPQNRHVDIYFHHFNYDLFKRLIYDNIGNYSAYVLMPVDFKDTRQVIEKLPKDKVYILDQMQDGLQDYAAIYQNFEKDLFESLVKLVPRLNNYGSLKLLFPESHQPIGMLKGFQKFAQLKTFDCEIIRDLSNWHLSEGSVYLILDDKQLILLIKKAKQAGLIIGKDIGVISYNDTMLKEVLADGITTISTDFAGMGARLAEMISQKQQIKVENPHQLIIRNSL